MSEKKYKTLKQFYPFYLTEHVNRTNRILHVVGTTLVILFLLYCMFAQRYLWIILTPVIGYAFAWIGHFIFEKNRPATFEYPLYSFVCDFIMWFQVITGQIGLGKKGYKAPPKN